MRNDGSLDILDTLEAALGIPIQVVSSFRRRIQHVNPNIVSENRFAAHPPEAPAHVFDWPTKIIVLMGI